MSAPSKILVIDDEVIVRDTLGALLSSGDVELLFAQNGADGLRCAREHRPDAILLDVMMPDMDGYETCRQIRSDSVLAEIPIVMITALDDRDARLAGLSSGADDFLTKPFDGFEIQIRIRNMMRLNRYRHLLAERSRFSWVVDNSEQGYLILDDNNDIQYANQHAQAYFHLPELYAGINFDQQAGRYYQLNQPEDGNTYQAGYFVQPESATAHAFWLKVEMLKSSLDLEDQHLVRVSDVSEEMSAYHDVRKINFVAAHKLRTPVSRLYLDTTLLNRNLDNVPADEVKSIVREMGQDVEHLVKEVHEILNYINAPVALVHGSPFLLGRLPEMIVNASEILELKNVTTILPDQLAECGLNISALAMELIVHEVLENSKKFHPSRLPHIHITVAEKDGDGVQIRFMDDGQLMTAKQIAQAKQPYLQAEKWFTGEVSGMGLGIPLVATMVWQAGGKMRIENREDQVGVCVSLTLPKLKMDSIRKDGRNGS
jgi:DNA-binding response OmpR family regulator